MDLATSRQVDAANPQRSTWLSANAGSGKTKVLTDRVARLLLNGTEPQKVLCLTYTKAAASEMQNRLLKRLGVWAMLDEDALRGELARLGEPGPISADRLAQARRLFAQAIEAPGGLKIQTIHSFCGALLRRFPLEAGVPHGFSELDERSAADIQAQIIEEIAAGPDRPVLDALARHYSGEDLRGLALGIARHKDVLDRPPTRAGILAALHLPPDLTPDNVPALAFQGDEKRLFDAVLPVLRGQSATMQKLAGVLAGIKISAPGRTDLDQLCGEFLYKRPVPEAKTSLLTKNAVKELGDDLAQDFMDFAARVADARAAEFALGLVERSLALSRFGAVFVPLYRARKAQSGWLDFDDLIERAGALLASSSVAQWVLFRLDGGIDHILVDEAQDTSPGQWAVIERLADEFTAGEGARDEARTIFVVGDRKQSIYSFQGADLQRFEAMRTHFAEKFAAVGQPLQSSELQHSFRSAPAVLRLVDLAFSGGGSVGLGGTPQHIAFFDAMPGRVDLWQPILPQKDKPEDDWEDPVDLPGAQDGAIVLARTIAAEIRAMIDAGTQIPDGSGARPVHEGDFLILVQKRALLFQEIIRSCKAAGLAVAGADRLRLGAELAVRDICAVLAFLATPEDDLALASALRSPLFGWTEDDLFALAHPRKGYLWAALRHSETRPETLVILQDLLDQADFLRPFDVIERLLNRHAGRERLLARLGPEAEDGIDELLSQALAYETTEIPSLTGFLGWLGADDIEISRQLENQGRTIRVMTVHGAKGLEAPIVILPDTAKPRPPRMSDLLRTDDGPLLWKGGAGQPPIVRDLTEAEASRAREERMRLLYVALTRAEKWLIVAAAGEVGAGEDSWYALVADGMVRAGTQEAQALSANAQSLGPVLRHASGDWPDAGAVAALPVAARATLPDWALTRAPRPDRAKSALSPSDLGGAKALPGETEFDDTEQAKRYGRQLHLLLEHLPEADPAVWDTIARDLLSFGPDRATEPELGAVLVTARRALEAAGTAGFLAPGTLAEVEISADLPELGGQRVHGTIDRLRITPERIDVLDYKSNAVVPGSAAQIPDGIVRQMAAYRAALQQIYPGRVIGCAVLWTTTGTLTWLEPAQMDGALRTVCLP